MRTEQRRTRPLRISLFVLKASSNVPDEEFMSPLKVRPFSHEDQPICPCLLIDESWKDPNNVRDDQFLCPRRIRLPSGSSHVLAHIRVGTSAHALNESQHTHQDQSVSLKSHINTSHDQCVNQTDAGDPKYMCLGSAKPRAGKIHSKPLEHACS